MSTRMKKKIFKIIECNDECPMKNVPAYDSMWCNFYEEDLNHFHHTPKKKKPGFCKVKRIIVEEHNSVA